MIRGPGSVVCVPTGYGLNGSGIESQWRARFSAPLQTGPGAHPASCTMDTGSFLGVKTGPDVTLTPHALLVLWSWKARAIPLLPPVDRTACTEPRCLYEGALYQLIRYGTARYRPQFTSQRSAKAIFFFFFLDVAISVRSVHPVLVLRVFCFNAPSCQFTPLLNLRPTIFGLTPCGWLLSVTLSPCS